MDKSLKIKQLNRGGQATAAILSAILLTCCSTADPLPPAETRNPQTDSLDARQKGKWTITWQTEWTDTLYRNF